MSLLRFPKTTNDSQLAEMIIGEMVRGSAWTFSSSMVHVYVTVGCNHKSRCVFPLCAHVWSTVTYFDMQIRRAASVTLSANFSQGTVTSSSTHSSTKAVFCLCGELLFSEPAASAGETEHILKTSMRSTLTKQTTNDVSG